ncbi:N-acetylglucosamine-6-phosphate deacetylase [Sporomusa aerivorans]|uniref:N-acetylglucosamine-6-phosphate deacetylase n=1 Tax=Sporomusa aerivorans TaxID=204936 RepID=UPI00352B0779
MLLLKAIYNAKIVTASGVLEKHAVVYEDKIIDIVPEARLAAYAPAEKMDAGGHYLAPGFIDLHIHGCAGADTMDEEEDALAVMSKALPATGVTAFLPTTMTMPFVSVAAALSRIRASMGSGQGAKILGCHLEGPFISAEYRGAQDARHILKPSYRKIADFADVIKIVTIAPELPASLSFIRQAAKANIVVAIGHSAAGYEELLAAIEAGASHITHTFNALAVPNHRQPGILGAVTDSLATCELIADNIHVHPAMQRLLVKLAGGERLVLITDAMRAALMPDGNYDLGGQQVRVANGTARLESGVIAGSVLTLNRAVANFWQTSGLPLHEVLAMATRNPARKLGLERERGSIAPGLAADMVVFDNDITPIETVIKGKTVYRRLL